MESNDSPEIPDRGETSDIPGLPSGGLTTWLYAQQRQTMTKTDDDEDRRRRSQTKTKTKEDRLTLATSELAALLQLTTHPSAKHRT